MDLAIPVLVSVDERERFEVQLVHDGHPPFLGPSLARLLDDVALYLMERIPNENVDRMPRYELCPHVELRKPKIAVGEWQGRISAVVSRFPEDKHFVVTIPRLSSRSFALDHPRNLSEAVARIMSEWAKERGGSDLDAVCCRPVEYLEVVTVDAELPTVLPSRPLRKKPKRRARKEEEQTNTSKKKSVVPPVTLRAVATNLTHRAADGRLPRAFLRDALVEELLRRMSRPGAAVLMVGPSGVGKTAVAQEVTRRLAAKAHRIDERTEVWQVDGNRIIAGMRMVGAWERRVRDMVGELSARQDVLFVDDLPALAFTGRSAHGDANVADFLEPHLARGDLRVLGECTRERLNAVEEEAPGFFSRFSIVQVPPLSEQQTLIALVHAARAYAEEEDVVVDPEALETIVHLTRRFQPNQVFPGKAMSLLYRTLSSLGAVQLDDVGRKRLERRRVVERYGRDTGLPDFVLTEQAARDIREVEAHFEERIIAQPEARRAAVDVVALLEQGLDDPGRPLASYLFVGPTGVGKTETAKAIAEILFGGRDRMIRLDMSEFRTWDSVSRLFGDRLHPDGELTLAVERQPFSVILLDEIEKAHPSVFDALLQVLGEGRLTNAAGRTSDFSSTVVVMTSNLGVRDAGRNIGFGEPTQASLQMHYRRAAERFFRPELFNRIDRIVAFSPLGREAILPLVRRLMEQMLTRRGLVGNQVVVEVDPQVVELIVDQGFDDRYGARSIKRMLEKRLAVPLAQHIATHYVRDLTLADIHPFGSEIRMGLSWPSPARVARLPDIELPKTWRGLEQDFARLASRFERLLESPELMSLRREHARLVDRVNRGERTDDLHDRLTSIAALLEQASELANDVSAFRTQHLEEEPFEVRFDLERPDNRKQRKTILSTEYRPVRIDRGPRLTEARASLGELRFALARFAFRFRALAAGPDDDALLLVAPVRSFGFGIAIARSLNHYFHLWGRSTLLFRTEEGWQSREPDGTPAAVALALRGAGISSLARRVVGFYGSAAGGTHLARVELVRGTGDAFSRLAERERMEQDWRERRRLSDAPDPRPTLPLRFMLERDPIDDPETGVPISIHNLGLALHEATLIRLYSELAEEAS